jgi:hypothetical protein
MQRLHCLLNWGIRVESVDLQQVDVVGIKALERSIYSVEDSLARQTTLVCVVPELRQLLPILNGPQPWVLACVTEAFCKDNKLVARKLVLLNRFANDLFRDTIGVNISCDAVLAG